MKKQLDEKRALIRTVSFYVFVTVASLMLFYQFLNNRQDLFRWLNSIVNTTLNVMMPLLVAILIGYLMRPLVDGLEGLIARIPLLKRLPRFGRQRRLVALLIVYVALIAALLLALFSVIPMVITNLSDLISQMPGYINAVVRYINELIAANPSLQHPSVRGFMDSLVYQVENLGVSAQQVMSLVPGIIRQVFSLSAMLFSVMLAFVMSFYMVWANSGLFDGLWRMLEALVGTERAESLKLVAEDSDRVFNHYFVGRIIESLVVGVLCFLGLLFFKTRFSTLLSTFYGIINLVPYLGPIIGLIPIALITAMDTPGMTLWIIAFLCILQFFDAYVLAPKVLGDRLGLHPFWIVLSVTIGGSLFGLMGLFLATPVVSLVMLVGGRYIARRKQDRETDAETVKRAALEGESPALAAGGQALTGQAALTQSRADASHEGLDDAGDRVE